MRKIPWVDVLTGAGVVVSLLFVGIQIRENTKAVRSSTVAAITDQVLELNAHLISVPELRAAYTKALQGQTAELTPQEEDVLTYWYASVLRVAENRFRQRQLGTFTGEQAASGSAAVAYRLPFFKAYWLSRRHTYASDFAVFVDTALIPLVQDSFPRAITRWLVRIWKQADAGDAMLTLASRVDALPRLESRGLAKLLQGACDELGPQNTSAYVWFLGGSATWQFYREGGGKASSERHVG